MTTIKSVISLPLKNLDELVETARDFCFCRGICRWKPEYAPHTVTFVPFCLLPSSFDRDAFEFACALQIDIQLLYHKISQNETFLHDVLHSTVAADPFMSKLWDVYKSTVHDRAQSKSMAIVRSDYMLDSEEKIMDRRLKQIEVNTMSVSFGGISPAVQDMHRFILGRIGDESVDIDNIPYNGCLDGIVEGILEAWTAYGNNDAIVLMVIEDVVTNIYDQRAVEYALGERTSYSVRMVRRTMPALIQQLKLGPNRELMLDGKEVSVVYWRTGYDPEQMSTQQHWDIRLLIERSKSIKCPCVAWHLAGSKRVQQHLARKGVVESIMGDGVVSERIRRCFAGLYGLDLTPEGDVAAAMAMETPQKFVLKPDREGGGHNVYREKVADAIRQLGEKRAGYILMEYVAPSITRNYIAREAAVQECDVVSELGIIGTVFGYQMLCLKEICSLLRCTHLGVRATLS